MPNPDIYKNDLDELTQADSTPASIEGFTDRREGRDLLGRTSEEPWNSSELASLAQELENFVWTPLSEAAIYTLLACFNDDYLGGYDLQSWGGWRSSGWKANEKMAYIHGPAGTGKTQLLRVLLALWGDLPVNEHGHKARAAAGGLSTRIKDELRNLDAMAGFKGDSGFFKDKTKEDTPPSKPSDATKRKNARKHVAAGRLPVDKDASLGILEIIFHSLGLPGGYPQAKLYLRLRAEGTLTTVEEELKKAGKSLLDELDEMYVSPHLSAALAKTEGFPSDLEAIRATLKYEFPPRRDLSTEEQHEVLAEAFEAEEDFDFPMTLIAVEFSPHDPRVSERGTPLDGFAYSCSYMGDQMTQRVASPLPGFRFNFVATCETEIPPTEDHNPNTDWTSTPLNTSQHDKTGVSCFRQRSYDEGWRNPSQATGVNIPLSAETMMDVWQELILAKTKKGEYQLKNMENRFSFTWAEAFVRSYPLSPDTVKLWKGVFKGMPAWIKDPEFGGLAFRSPAESFRQALIAARQSQSSSPAELGQLITAEHIADDGTLLDALLANGRHEDHCRKIREYLDAPEQEPWEIGRVLSLILLISLCQDEEKILADKETIATLCCDKLSLLDSVPHKSAMWEETGDILEELERQQLVVFINNQYFLPDNRLHLPPCRIENEKDLTAWVKKIREEARRALKKGPIIFRMDDRD